MTHFIGFLRLTTDNVQHYFELLARVFQGKTVTYVADIAGLVVQQTGQAKLTLEGEAINFVVLGGLGSSPLGRRLLSREVFYLEVEDDLHVRLTVNSGVCGFEIFKMWLTEE